MGLRRSCQICTLEHATKHTGRLAAQQDVPGRMWRSFMNIPDTVFHKECRTGDSTMTTRTTMRRTPTTTRASATAAPSNGTRMRRSKPDGACLAGAFGLNTLLRDSTGASASQRPSAGCAEQRSAKQAVGMPMICFRHTCRQLALPAEFDGMQPSLKCAAAEASGPSTGLCIVVAGSSTPPRLRRTGGGRSCSRRSEPPSVRQSGSGSSPRRCAQDACDV